MARERELVKLTKTRDRFRELSPGKPCPRELGRLSQNRAAFAERIRHTSRHNTVSPQGRKDRARARAHPYSSIQGCTYETAQRRCTAVRTFLSQTLRYTKTELTLSFGTGGCRRIHEPAKRSAQSSTVENQSTDWRETEHSEPLQR